MKASLTDDEFARLTTLLHDRAGLVFEQTRRDSVAYSVGQRLLHVGCATVAEYVDLVSSDAAETQALLDEVTIPETYFFRNPPQMRALRRRVLPELVRAAAETRRLVIWSAGCSTGEEPYTLAMTLSELIPDIDSWSVRIIATDVSQRALAAARRGSYGKRALQLADDATVSRWFETVDGEYRVVPALRRLVEFRHHNLVTDAAPFVPGEVDLVLCRNVTIYFDRSTTRGLVGRFHRALRPEGYLLLGHAETLWQVTDAFRLVAMDDAFLYRKEPAAPVVAAPAAPAPSEPVAGAPAGRRLPLPRAPRLRLPRFPLPPPAARVAAEPTLETVGEQLRAGRYVEAADVAAAVIRVQPLLAEAHYLRGMALVNLGRDSDALVNLRKAVFLDPGAGFAHFLLAGALARLGERVAAERSYQAAADTLGNRAGDAAAAELGGRSIDELIELCRLLAGGTGHGAAVRGR